MTPEDEILHPKNSQIISIHPYGSSLAKFKHQDYETAEYFSFKKLLRNSYYHNKSFFTKLIKTRCKLFNRPSTNDLSPFERILIGSEDKSAVISLALRTFNLWSDSVFWTKMINLEIVMKQFANNQNVNIKNLFSILLYDWHCPSNVSTSYALCEKFEAYEMSGESLFSKLFEIIDDENYRGYELICLRIIYQFLHEKNERLKQIGNFYEKTLLQDRINNAINEAIKIRNKDYKIQILKILTVFLDNTGDENYGLLKDKILENVNFSFECCSVYRIPIDAIEKHCDEHFFKLSFLLKENRLKKFEFEFEEFLKIYQKYYGEYWKVSIKQNIRLLYHIAEERCDRKMLKVVEFIFNKCSFIELNSTILTTFEEVADFYRIFIEPLNADEEKFMECIDTYFEKDFINCIDEFASKCLHDKRFNIKLLLGRESIHKKSLLEQILSHPSLYSVLVDIWKKFQLYDRPEILTLKNFMGKSLMYYVCHSGANQIGAFLMLPVYNKNENFNKPKHYMMLQNSQIFSICEKSLMEYQVDIFLGKEELEYDIDLFVRIIYLLEEIGTIQEIKADEEIEYFLDLMNKTERLSSELFEIDDLLGVMIIYWRPYKGDYQKYKKILIDMNPLFDLLFMVIEKRYDEFIEKFPSKFDELEDVYETRYDVSVVQKESSDHLHELYSSNFMFILFLAAIRTNQSKIIDFIFKNDWFVTINFGFPENVKAREIHYYAALNLLKHGHELGRANIPEDWMTYEVLQEFLDSRIRYRNKDYIEIDCASLLHAESQKIKVKVSSDVTDKLLMLEDTVSLQYIKEHENLKGLITHPVIETYIDLKSYKYERIFVYNFWAFVIFYILPFIALISHNHNAHSENYIWTILISNRWHYVGIVFLIIRESFQCLISGSLRAYFIQRSNIFDMILIILSITLSIFSLFSCKTNNSYINSSCMAFLEVALILFTTISATSLLPLAYVPINMQILKKVSMTFLKIFYTFAIILIAFSFSFCIMFENNFNGVNNDSVTNSSSAQNSSDENAVKKEDEKEEDGETIDNFKYPHTSLIKIITMLSGEYSIEPIKLSHVQLVFFAFFVISSFILFNLILGLSIEDVQELKNGSRQFNLLTKTKKLINVGQKLETYYNYVMETSENRFSERKLDILIDILINISTALIRFFLSKYMYVHSIRKVYVNIKSKEVYVNVNQKYERILKTHGYRKDDVYTVNNNTLAEIQDIINQKNKKMFKNLKKRMQLEEFKEIDEELEMS